jgi:hypothetical protein
MTTPEPVIHLAISPRTAEALRRRLAAPKTCAEYDSGDTELLELVSAELAAQLGGLPPESPTPVAKPRALAIAEQMAAAGTAAVKAAA